MNRQPFVPLIIPVKTIVRVVAAIFLIWLILELRQILLLIFIAFLVAAALSPLVHRLEARGWSVGAAVGAIISVVIGMISVGVWFLIPELVAQGQVLVDTMPDYLDRAQVFLKRYPALNDRVQGIFEPPAGGGEVTDVPVSRVLEAGSAVVQGLLNVFLVLVMAVYILLDGERVYNQIARFLSPVQQIKFRKAMPEFVTVVSGYVVGQFITSLMFGVFAFVTLTAFGVPQALLLAMFAAFMDAIPLVGAPLATIPAVLAALTVSVPTAVGVLALYLVYQQLENYLIVPRIYGRTLQVSPLSVLIGVLVGGELLGIVGILLALPLTAAIPIAVRLWREEVEAPSSAIDPAAPAVEVPLTSHE